MTTPASVLGGEVGRYAWAEGAIAYESAGEGPTVLLLHAVEIGGGRAEWRELFPRLAAAGYRVIAPDLLGFGDSEQPCVRYDSDLCICQIAEFVQRLVGASCHVVARGHSVAYAAVLAVADPARFPSLVAIAPYGLRPVRQSERVYRRYTAPLLGALRHRILTSRRMLHLWLATDVYFDPRHAGADLERACGWARGLGAGYVTASLLSGALSRDVRREWAELPQPTLLLWGQACDDPPFDDIESWLAPLRPDAPVTMIDHRPIGVWKQEIQHKTFADARQRPHVEAPEAVAAVVLEHLERVEARLRGAAAGEVDSDTGEVS